MEVRHEAGADEGRLADLVTTVRDVVRRRWRVLALIAAAVFALGVGLTLLMPPQYTAGARIRIDPSRNPLSNNTADAQSALAPEAIETEVTVLSSADLARAVVKRLGLVNDPEFSKALQKDPAGSSLSPAERESAIAGAIMRKLSVGREKLTYILDVRFTSRDPFKAAKIANAFAQTYIDSKVGSNTGTAERQSEWFQKRLQSLGNEVREADARLAQYRAAAGIVQGSDPASGGTIADQQVAPLSTALAGAESEAAAARANLAAARQQVARGGGNDVSEVLSSPVIGDLRRQRTEILRSQGEVEARYGERHPESIRVRDQLSSIDAQIKEESNRVINSLQANATAASARAGSLAASMSRLEGQRAADTRASVMASALEREVAAKRALYDRMSQMSLESTQAAQNSIAQAEIIDRAEPPAGPTSPNKPLLFALSLILGLVAGGAFIAIQEMLVSGMRTIDEVENQLGVPVLAAVPRMNRVANPADLLLEKPTSLYAEALRIARAAILGVRTGKQVKVIAITSALPSEGKTTTALAFARTLAINNARVLLIDCDVRRAAMRQSVRNPPDGPGLVELLHGETTIDQVIHPGDVPGLDQLLVRSPYFSSEDLFGGGGMEQLVADMRERYDLVVLDLPPLVGLADGRFLAVLADVTVLALTWDATPAAAVSSSLSWLRADGANPIGVIYTMVDSSAEAIGGLYYSKKYSAYYQAG